MSRLDEILEYKRGEVAQRKAVRPLEVVKAAARQTSAARDFLGALTERARLAKWPALIAEVKRASPSKGALAPDIDAAALATTYTQNGAAAISVLTDERFFCGSLEDLRRVAQAAPGAPALRKDFILEAYQVYEARAAGADAVLLITAALESERLAELHQLTLDLGMTPLVEVHSLDELEAALACQPRLVGINNRDLSTFKVDLQTTLRLRQHIPSSVRLVAESGIHSRADVARLAQAGVDAILVGEAFVTSSDIPGMVRSLARGDER